MLLTCDAAQLLVVDIQEKLLPAMHRGEHAAAQAGILIRAARQLGVPITISEQYPRGLGPTVSALLEAAAGEACILPKTHFSCHRAPGIAQRLGELASKGRRQVVLCGIEAHICVTQTALDLHAAGYGVAVVTDAIDSREPSSKAVAITRLVQAGIVPVTAEMVLFEWLGEAGTADFKALLPLIK
ncbi:MAG: hypothetical protein JWL62_3424 [Hyphomicrobiales bacterium]|nr:hypothetical protein [Hyphomicrobiales bacterium]